MYIYRNAALALACVCNCTCVKIIHILLFSSTIEVRFFFNFPMKTGRKNVKFSQNFSQNLVLTRNIKSKVCIKDAKIRVAKNPLNELGTCLTIFNPQ